MTFGFSCDSNCLIFLFRIVIFLDESIVKMLVVGRKRGDGDPLGEIGE